MSYLELTDDETHKLIYGYSERNRFGEIAEWKGIYRQTLQMLLYILEIGNNLEKYKKIHLPENYEAPTFATDFHGSEWYFLQYLLNSSAFNEQKLQKKAKELLGGMKSIFLSVPSSYSEGFSIYFEKDETKLLENIYKFIPKLSEKALKEQLEGLNTDIICFINLDSNSSSFEVISYKKFKEESEKNLIRVACYVPIINPEYFLPKKLCTLGDFFDRYDYELSIFFQAIILKLRNMDVMHNLLGNHEIFRLIGDFQSAKDNKSYLPFFIDEEKQRKIFFDPISNFMKLNWKELFDICYYFEQDGQKNLASHTFLSPAIISTILERTVRFGIFTQEEKDEFEKNFFKIKNPESKIGDLILNYENLNVNLKKFIETLLEKLENETDPIKIQRIKNLILAPFSTRYMGQQAGFLIFRNDKCEDVNDEYSTQIRENISFFQNNGIFYVLGHSPTVCGDEILQLPVPLVMLDHSSSERCSMIGPLAKLWGTPYITLTDNQKTSSIPLLPNPFVFERNPRELITYNTTEKGTETKVRIYMPDNPKNFIELIIKIKNFEEIEKIEEIKEIEEIKQFITQQSITGYIIDAKKLSDFKFIGVYNKNGYEHKLYLNDENQLFIGVKCLEDFIQNKAAPIFQKDSIPVGYYDGTTVHDYSGEDYYGLDFEHTDVCEDMSDMSIPNAYILIQDKTNLPSNIIDMGYYFFDDKSHHYYYNQKTHQILIEFDPKQPLNLLPGAGLIYDYNGNMIGNINMVRERLVLCDQNNTATTRDKIIESIQQNTQTFEEVSLRPLQSEQAQTAKDKKEAEEGEEEKNEYKNKNEEEKRVVHTRY